MVTCRGFLCVYVCVCQYNKQQECILGCEVQGLYFPSLLISLPWWLLVCIQTYDSPGGLVGEASSPKRCQVPDSEQMLTNSNTNTPEGPSVCMCLDIFLTRGRVRMAGIELHWSRTSSHGHLPVHDASQKTDKPNSFLFCDYNVNGAPVWPLCNHPRPTDCTESGLDSLSFSVTFLSCLSLAAFIRLRLPLSLYCSLLSTWRADILFLPDRRNLYFITATYEEKYFLPTGDLACNYNAAPNILFKIYSILFLTYMSLWSPTWHQSVARLLWVFPYMSLYGWITQLRKALRLFKLTCIFFPHHLWKVCHQYTMTDQNNMY